MPTTDELIDDLRGYSPTKVFELIKVEWPSPTGTIYYSVQQLDELLAVPPPVVDPIVCVVQPQSRPDWFSEIDVSGSIGDEDVSIEAWDADGTIADLLILHGEGIRTTIEYWFPQVELLLPVWEGHLKLEEEAGPDTIKLKAVQGFRDAEGTLPGGGHFQHCWSIFGGLLDTQDEIDLNPCPYNKHLVGGTVGNNNPDTGLPWTFCDRLSTASCVARGIDPLFHFSHRTITATVFNGQTHGSQLWSTSQGNETNLSSPPRVVMGYRRVYGCPVVAFRRDLNNNHKDDGWFFALYEVGFGQHGSFSGARFTVGSSTQDAVPMHYGYRLGTYGQTAVSNLTEHGYSGIGLLLYNFGWVDPTTVDPSNASGSVITTGIADIRTYNPALAGVIAACGAECSLAGLEDLTGHIYGGSSIISADTSVVRSGLYSIKFTPTGSNMSGSVVHTGGNTTFSGRLYWRCTGFFTDNQYIIVSGGTSLEALGIAFNPATNTLHCGSSLSGGFPTYFINFAGTGYAVSVDTWYRIDFKIDRTAGTVDAQVTVGDDDTTTVSLAQAVFAVSTPAIADELVFGAYPNHISGAVTSRWYFDDIIITNDLANYPIGAGYIHGYVPTADGTHNITAAGRFRRDTTSTDITNATTTAHQLVSGRPMSGNDGVSTLGPPDATNYVEITFGPATGSAAPTSVPRVVVSVCGQKDVTDSGQPYAGTVKLVDNATTSTMQTVNRAFVSSTPVYESHCYQLAPSGAAWSISGSGNGSFNNLKARFATSTQSNTATYRHLFLGTVLEAEFGGYLTGTSSNRAWQIARMLTDKVWGYGYDYSRLDLADWADTAAWCAQQVRFTDAFGNNWDHVRAESNVELIGKKSQEQFEDMCLAGRLSRPFLYEGKLHLKPFAALTTDDLDAAPVFTDETVDGIDRNIIWEDGKTTLTISRKSDLDLVNQVKVTFDDRSQDWIETPLRPVEDEAAQLRAGRVLGDSTRKVNTKSYKLLGVDYEPQAVKMAWSLLDLGQFDEGGLQNNLELKFNIWYLGSLRLYPTKVIKVVSSRVQRYKSPQDEPFTFFRVKTIKRTSKLIVELTVQAYNKDYMDAFESGTAISGDTGAGGYCSTDSNCPDGYECRNGICLPIIDSGPCSPGIASVVFGDGIITITPEAC